MKTLICAAIDEEINRVAEKANSEIIIKKLGIGLIDSAISISTILKEHSDIARVIFTGTAGAYLSSALKIGDIVNATSHELIGAGTILGQSYFPKFMKREFRFEDFLQGQFKNVKSASVLEITSNDDLAAKINMQSAAEIEHMEMFSIARVCESHGLAFNAVVGIANLVGEKSHEEWLKNHESVSKSTQIALISSLQL